MRNREKVEYNRPSSELQAENVWKSFAGFTSLFCRLDDIKYCPIFARQATMSTGIEKRQVGAPYDNLGGGGRGGGRGVFQP